VRALPAHTHTPTHTRSALPTHTRTHAHTHTHTQRPADAHTHTHTHTRTQRPAAAHTHARTRTRTRQVLHYLETLPPAALLSQLLAAAVSQALALLRASRGAALAPAAAVVDR
jgi:hypothetical protein